MSEREAGEETADDLGLDPGLARQLEGAEEEVVAADCGTLEQMLAQGSRKGSLTVSPPLNCGPVYP
jgi:hypothetical protein